MEDYLIYIAKVSIATFIFYLAFLLLFQNRKQFVFNRLFLPVSFLISYLIPLISIPVVRTVEMTSFEMTGPVFSSTQAAETKVEALFPIEWHQLLLGIYLLGLCGFLFQLILGNLKAFRIIQKSRKGTLFGMPVNLTIQDVHPFAFFNRIVISENTLASPDIEMIVTHENIHVKENHTLDVILTELLFLFQWFNPFAWLIKDAVKNNLEYKTDHQVVQKFNPKTYQLAMVSLADKSGVTPFLNSLNGSQLKNRIIMMKSKKENKYAIVKQLAVIPLLAFLVVTLANREVKSEVVPAISQNNTTLEGNALLAPDEGKFIVKGTVTSKTDKTPVAGVAVVVKGKPVGTISDQQGHYEIKLEDNNEELIFSLPGREKIIVKADKPTIDIEIDAIKSRKINENLKKELEKLNGSNFPITIKGHVSGTDGKPIIYASVLIKGANIGTITDVDGNYSIKVPENKSTLVFIQPSYERKEVTVEEMRKIDIQLKPVQKVEKE